MSNARPFLQLDIFNYANEKLCNIYDSENDISGQAYDVVIQSERNGWRELSFNLPDKIYNADGEEDNFRLQYLLADFRIRAIDDISTEWYIISEQKITHNAFTKSYSISAGHCCQLLKLKKLDLEFSDDEGNNTGTIEELAHTIIDGTGWEIGTVYDFKEKDGETTKIRSLKASKKTGAFKLMSSLCDLFDAKPVYHSEVFSLLATEPDDFEERYYNYYTKDDNGNRTRYIPIPSACTFETNTYYSKRKIVDIVEMNPFSDPEGGTPSVESNDVVELHYGKNVSNVTRSLNTEDIVTKLYAYGSYGDDTKGYCSISECKHKRYTFYNNTFDTHWYTFNISRTSLVEDYAITLTESILPTGNEITAVRIRSTTFSKKETHPVGECEYYYDSATRTLYINGTQFLSSYETIDATIISGYAVKEEYAGSFSYVPEYSSTGNVSKDISVSELPMQNYISEVTYNGETFSRVLTLASPLENKKFYYDESNRKIYFNGSQFSDQTKFITVSYIKQNYKNSTFCFSVLNEDGTNYDYQFDCSDMEQYSTFTWSDIDPFSKTYIWNCDNGKAYKVCAKTNSSAIPLCINSDYARSSGYWNKYINISENIKKGSLIKIGSYDFYRTTKDIDANIVAKLYIKTSKNGTYGLKYLMNNNIEYAYNIASAGTTYDYYFVSNTTSETYEYEELPNLLSFLFDFDYYQTVGLMSEDQFQDAAEYQINYPEKYSISSNASTLFSENLTNLREIIGTNNYCKLDISSISGTTEKTLELNYKRTVSGVETGKEDGIIYHTQYDEKRKNKFKWRIVTEYLANGDPKEDYASMLYIIHKNSEYPIEFQKVRLRSINGIYVNENINYDAQYERISLWTVDSWSNGQSISTSDLFYLFSSDSISGSLGAIEALDESAEEGLESATKVATTEHPTQYTYENPPSGEITSLEDGYYGWWWKYDRLSINSEWYFIWKENDNNPSYKRVYYDLDSNKKPENLSEGIYWYDWLNGAVYRYNSNVWVKLDGDDDIKIMKYFGSVLLYCLNRDKYRIGRYSEYTSTVTQNIPYGNYYFKNGFGTYHLFSKILKDSSTEPEYPFVSGDILKFDTTDLYVTKNNSEDETFKVESKSFNSVTYYKENIMQDVKFTKVTSAENTYQSNYFRIYSGTDYIFSAPMVTLASSGSKIDLYTSKYTQLGDSISLTNPADFETIANTSYAKVTLVIDDENIIDENYLINKCIIHASNYLTSILVDEEEYKLFPNEFVGGEELLSLVHLTDSFYKISDSVYGSYFTAMQTAQNDMSKMTQNLSDSLEDIYREGYWQDDDYVDGDETRLYDDALDNLEEIAKPKATYNITYHYLNDQPFEEGLSNETLSVKWPDISTSMAAHLIDQSVDINVWAFIDKIQKCYDKPWNTSITINTQLKTLTQHSFSDVMSNIASVASEVKGNLTKYDATASENKSYNAEKLEGTISANQIKFDGGKSSWYTDNDGNMIFESADKSSAMKLTGYGMCVANSKNDYGEWRWRNFLTGNGGVADEITVGSLSADRIEAGSITVDKIASDVGSKLILESSEAINNIINNSDLSAHFDFGTTTSGTESIPYMDIYAVSKTDTSVKFKTRITNTKMEFYWQDKVLAEYTQNGIVAKEADIENNIKIGNLKIQSLASGAVAFAWAGN